MIFVTVGTQLAFDRFIGAIDEWCAANPGVRVFAQVGPTKLTIRHMEHEMFISQERANQLFLEASLIVTHAGMGSVLTGLKYRKPLLIVPRKASLGEHRNEHQMATAKWLAELSGIQVVWEEADISAALDNHQLIQHGAGISEYATPELINNLKNFISE
jgi:UDP-N-acetylglucosamine transferase subunit ALG13